MQLNIDKILKKNTIKFEEKKKKNIEHWKKHDYGSEWIETQKQRKYSFSIPWRPRLGIFKYKARSKVTFDPNTFEANSYGHWCFVKIIKGKVVFNDYRYSVTTTRHQRMVRCLLSELGVKIDITVNQSQCLNSGIQLHPLYHDIFNNEIAINRKGSRLKTKKQAIQSIKSLKKEITVLKKLGGSIDKNRIETIKKEVLDHETWRLIRVKEKHEAWKLANADMLKKKQYNKDFGRILK